MRTMDYYEKEIINALTADNGSIACAEGAVDEVFFPFFI